MQTNCKIPTSPRKIIHIDMDAFYASVEQRDRPELRGKPVVVGGDPQSRGVVASASYEARKYGIRSAMSCAKAFRLQRNTVFIPPNFEKYLAVSHRIRQIFLEATPWVEPLALDEAYLDVTQNLLGEPIASKIAQTLKTKIRSELDLTASAGVGPNKFIAKIASDLKKPDGLVVVPPEKVLTFIENLPVEKFWGVGPATAQRLKARGLHSAADIRSSSPAELESIVGSYADFLYNLAHGRDDREVDPSTDPKSRGVETTFERDLTDITAILRHLEELAIELTQDLKEQDLPGRTITVKIKYSDFKAITRSHTLPDPTFHLETVFKVAQDLLFKDTQVGTRPVRLLGISISHFFKGEEPLQLWFDFPN